MDCHARTKSRKGLVWLNLFADRPAANVASVDKIGQGG